jgi:hypothetical protein
MNISELMMVSRKEEYQFREEMLKEIETKTGKKIEELDNAWVEMCIQMNFLAYQLEKLELYSIPKENFANA